MLSVDGFVNKTRSISSSLKKLSKGEFLKKFIILLLKKIDQNFNNNLSKKLNLIILDEIFLSTSALCALLLKQ
jgi:phosphohistidine swiveling domain-containing protein